MQAAPRSTAVCDAASGLRGGELVDAQAFRRPLAGDLDGEVPMPGNNFAERLLSRVVPSSDVLSLLARDAVDGSQSDGDDLVGCTGLAFGLKPG